MPMPIKVQTAYDQGNLSAIRSMRNKSARTRKEKSDARKLDRQRIADEETSADLWLQERRRLEAAQIARQRQDHLLPEDDDLPF